MSSYVKQASLKLGRPVNKTLKNIRRGEDDRIKVLKGSLSSGVKTDFLWKSHFVVETVKLSENYGVVQHCANLLEMYSGKY